MKEYKTYLAGAMQSLIDTDEGLSWRLKVEQELYKRLDGNIGLTVVIPNDYFNFSMSTDDYTYYEVYNFEMRAVKSCDFIIVNLNHHGSQGTSHELAIAREYDIPVIALIDTVEIGNVHPFDLECVDKVCGTIDELADYVNYYYLI